MKSMHLPFAFYLVAVVFLAYVGWSKHKQGNTTAVCIFIFLIGLNIVAAWGKA
jgi:hypothetical protein